MGTVLSGGLGGMCYVKTEDWFAASEKFTMGRWIGTAGGPPSVGEQVFMERATENGGTEIVSAEVVSRQ